MMKKEYVKPNAEKINFDYVESIVACPSGCSDPGHYWHGGSVYGSCFGIINSNNANNTNSNGNSDTQSTNNNNPYYAPGWGLHCS